MDGWTDKEEVMIGKVSRVLVVAGVKVGWER